MSGTYGLTSTAPLVSGEVSATANFTIPTTTGTVTGITTTLPIGTYLVWFSGSLTSNGTNSTATFGLYLAAALKTDSVRIIQPYDGGTLAAGSANGDISINARIVLATSTVVDVRASVPAGTATLHQCTMSWLQVNP